MANVIVVGTQWGDEGKGKIVDLLSEYFDAVARYQGGTNAGHTVVVGEEKIVLHLVPSGVLRKGKVCILGNGVVIDLTALIQEMDQLSKLHVKVEENFFISKNAHLVLPYHKILDSELEKLRGGRRIGTTGRGIGPGSLDKMARSGIRVGDLTDPALFTEPHPGTRGTGCRKDGGGATRGVRARPRLRGGQLSRASRADQSRQEHPVRRGAGDPP